MYKCLCAHTKHLSIQAYAYMQNLMFDSIVRFCYMEMNWKLSVLVRLIGHPVPGICLTLTMADVSGVDNQMNFIILSFDSLPPHHNYQGHFEAQSSDG